MHFGKFSKNIGRPHANISGEPRNINPHNPWLVCVGLFLIFTGFWGFYAACNVPYIDVQAGDGVLFSANKDIYLKIH